MLVKASCALAKIANTLVLKAVAESKEQLKELTDATALVLKTSHELSVDRRAKIVHGPSVNKKYRES